MFQNVSCAVKRTGVFHVFLLHLVPLRVYDYKRAGQSIEAKFIFKDSSSASSTYMPDSVYSTTATTASCQGVHTHNFRDGLLQASQESLVLQSVKQVSATRRQWHFVISPTKNFNLIFVPQPWEMMPHTISQAYQAFLGTPIQS